MQLVALCGIAVPVHWCVLCSMRKICMLHGCMATAQAVMMLKTHQRVSAIGKWKPVRVKMYLLVKSSALVRTIHRRTERPSRTTLSRIFGRHLIHMFSFDWSQNVQSPLNRRNHMVFMSCSLN